MKTNVPLEGSHPVVYISNLISPRVEASNSMIVYWSQTVCNKQLRILVIIRVSVRRRGEVSRVTATAEVKNKNKQKYSSQ